MAGGANRPGAGLPAWMIEANRRTREAEAQEQAAVAARRPARRVHCWVHATGADHAGLVLEWRRQGAGWMARVLWTTGGADLVCAWLDAEQIEALTPAEGPSGEEETGSAAPAPGAAVLTAGVPLSQRTR